MVEDTGLVDKMKGKGNQIAGDLKGDKSQALKGHLQEAKGDVKDAMTPPRRRMEER